MMGGKSVARAWRLSDEAELRVVAVVMALQWRRFFTTQHQAGATFQQHAGSVARGSTLPLLEKPRDEKHSFCSQQGVLWTLSRECEWTLE